MSDTADTNESSHPLEGAQVGEFRLVDLQPYIVEGSGYCTPPPEQQEP